MPPGAVGTGDELPFAQQFVSDDVTLEADWSERARSGAESAMDLVLGRRACIFPQCGEQLRLLESVVAAHEREQDRPVVLRVRHRFRRRRLVDVEQVREGLDRGRARGLDLLRRRERLWERRGAW